jgi:hypothetical protein
MAIEGRGADSTRWPNAVTPVTIAPVVAQFGLLDEKLVSLSLSLRWLPFGFHHA